MQGSVISIVVLIFSALITPAFIWLGARGFSLKTVGKTWIAAIIFPFLWAPVLYVLDLLFSLNSLLIEIGERLACASDANFQGGLSVNWECIALASRLTAAIEQMIIFCPMFGVLWLLPRPPLVRMLHVVAMLPVFIFVRMFFSSLVRLLFAEI